jgi:hypothetical protein
MFDGRPDGISLVSEHHFDRGDARIPRRFERPQNQRLAGEWL